MTKLNENKEASSNTKPFLRWAGGKRWLLKDINKYLPKNGFNNYHEPFVGSGAFFFNLEIDNQSYISDLNEELIETYKCVKDDVEGVIDHLRKFKNTSEDYYKIRKSKFRSDLKRAARFIYLNQTSFNGIYRVNLKGEYNVPYGHRHALQFDFDNLRKASAHLINTNISDGDFGDLLGDLQPNDLIFIDPPYTVTHNNNGFIKYNQKLFSMEDQLRLADTINQIREIGAFYILTNAAHDEIKRIFNNGDNITEVNRNSVVGGKNAKRGKYGELIITNTIE